MFSLPCSNTNQFMFSFLRRHSAPMCKSVASRLFNTGTLLPFRQPPLRCVQSYFSHLCGFLCELRCQERDAAEACWSIALSPKQ